MTAKALLVPTGIRSTVADDSSAGLNALIYGVSKVGKTALACSIVNHESVYKALHIDIDGSPRQLLVVEGLDQGVLINKPTPGYVDDPRCRLHQPDLS